MALAALLLAERAAAQYYTWGSDPAGLKWSRIRTPDVRIIYPDTAAAIADRTLFCIEKVKPCIGYGFRHPAMRIPFVMHPENFRSNGLVMWLPKRVEFLTSPAVESYAMPWYKQLTAHEYRHAVQYNNLNRGVIKALSYILGQQGSTIGLLYLPIWLLEGDAVMSETAMSSFGRGLQPSFTLEYRVLGRRLLDRRNPDKWFCGSYREYVPDHYQLGYQIAAYAYDRYDENIWDKVAWYSIRNPYLLFTTPIALKKFYGTSVHGLFDETFRRLNDFWERIPARVSSSEPILELDERNHTVYQWPVELDDTTFVAVKSDLDRTARLVGIDSRTGRERLIARTGDLSTRPDLSNGRIWWTEYRRSKLFEQRVNSQLCYLDLEEGRPRTVKGGSQRPLPHRDGPGRNRLGRVHARRPLHGGPQAQGVGHAPAPGPLFHRDTRHGVGQRHPAALRADDRRRRHAHRHLRRKRPLRTRHPQRLRHPERPAGPRRQALFRLHRLGLRRGAPVRPPARREYRLTRSRYGAFDPAPFHGDSILLTDYTDRGYRPARARIDTLRAVAYAPIPENIVNPGEKMGGHQPRHGALHGAGLAALARKTQAAPLPQGDQPGKGAQLDARSLQPLRSGRRAERSHQPGATLVSQNLLSNAEGFASWGWNRSEGSVYRLGFRYFGLGVHLNVDATYGGHQNIYSLAQRNPVTGVTESQRRPRADSYYSIGTSVGLPLYLQQGYRTRRLSLSMSWNYSNGLVANLGQIRYDELNHTITNLAYVDYREGLHKFSWSAGFSDFVRQAPREFAPRWGYTLYADYALNPANDDFSDLISFYARVYLPGIVRPHVPDRRLQLPDLAGRIQDPRRLPDAHLQGHPAAAARLLVGRHRQQPLQRRSHRLPAAALLSGGRHPLGALLQAHPPESGFRLRAVPPRRLAADLFLRCRPAAGYQPVPPAGIGHLHRQTLVLPSQPGLVLRGSRRGAAL